MASPAYERRQARARALGFRSYYDYRIHNHGRIPASEPAPSGEARARLRGHRSGADLLRALPSNAVLVPIDSERDEETGRFKWVDVDVMWIDENGQGQSRRYRLRGKHLEHESLDRAWAAIQDSGAIWAHNPSINLFAPALDFDAPDVLDLLDEAIAGEELEG